MTPTVAASARTNPQLKSSDEKGASSGISNVAEAPAKQFCPGTLLQLQVVRWRQGLYCQRLMWKPPASCQTVARTPTSELIEYSSTGTRPSGAAFGSGAVVGVVPGPGEPPPGGVVAPLEEPEASPAPGPA